MIVMSRVGRGKTETIKERTVYIYLPSFEMVEDCGLSYGERYWVERCEGYCSKYRFAR
ncbi:MAG: hypothetical protein QXI48_04820 [Candidatus Bathyarchaeia archaeon]